jgi:molybdate transport system regulatory protein
MATRYQAFAKVYVAREEDKAEGAFGNGLLALLRGVRETGSLNRAAKDMHMAYSKAWKLMNSAEERFGVQFIERDGARGSTLTAEGERLVAAYDAVSKDVNAYAARRMREELAKLS